MKKTTSSLVVAGAAILSSTALWGDYVQRSETLAADKTVAVDGRLTVEGAVALGKNRIVYTGVTSIDGAGSIAGGKGSAVCVEVPAFQTAANATVRLTGALALVKRGAGTLRLLKTGQDYTGGTEIAAGTLQAQNVAYPCRSLADVVTVGPGATLDVHQTEPANGASASCLYRLNGGRITNSGPMAVDFMNNFQGLGHVELLADSSIETDKGFGFQNFREKGTTSLETHGHTLTIDCGKGNFLFYRHTITGGGKVVVKRANRVDLAIGSLTARGTTFEAWTDVIPFDSGLQHEVGDFIMRAPGKPDIKDAILRICGVYTPVTDLINNYVLASGATLDLSGRKAPFNATGLEFAPNAKVTVDVHGRTFKRGECLVEWPFRPEGVSFTLDAASAKTGGKLALCEAGIYWGEAPKEAIAAEVQKDWAPGEWPVVRHFDGRHLEQISMPMGGIGTGCVGLGGRGELRDWQIKDKPDRGAPHHGNCNPFFALWAKPQGGASFVRMLSGPLSDSEYFAGTGGGNGSNAPNFGLPRFREASFDAAYPFGVANLSSADLPIRARVKGFSPFIPGDAEASGLPLAVLTYEIENLTDQPIEVSVCGAMRNFAGKTNVVKAGAGCKGLFFVGAGGSHALATATAGKVTTRTNMGKARWNGEIRTWWDDFSPDGEFTSGGASDSGSPLAALATKKTLDARGKTTFTFYVTWHFPVRSGWSSAPEKERNWYATRYRDAWDEIVKIVPRVPALEARTCAFAKAFAGSSLPREVKDAALSTAAVLKSPTVFRIASGHLMTWEGTGDTWGSCHGNCTHVWNYEYATAYLFGELARSMREVELVYGMEDNGLTWYRINLPLGKGAKGRVAISSTATDGQMGTLLQTYREWQLSGDAAFLKKMYPLAKKALSFAWLNVPGGGWDADRDGLMEGSQFNTMDCWYHGPNPLCEFWYLGALRAGEEMAKAMGDAAFAAECRRLFESGSKLTDEMLFNGDYYEQIVYRPGTKTPVDASNPASGAPELQVGAGCEADMLSGQNMALTLGLGWLANPAHIKKTLESIAKYNYLADFSGHFTNMRGYAMGNEAGLLNTSYPRGKRPAVPYPYYCEAWTGVEYTAGTGLFLVGDEAAALRTFRDVRDRHEGARRNPFSEPECGHFYARSMAAWSAVPAWCGFRYSGPSKTMSFAAKDGTWFWSNGAAFGTATVKGADVKLNVIEGKLPEGLRVFVRK